GYMLDERDAIHPAPPNSFATFGCGAVISTPRDLVAWDRALAAGVLLSEASTRRMFTPERDVGATVSTPSRYALGWFVSQSDGHEVVFHPGGVSGFETDFARVPDA